MDSRCPSPSREICVSTKEHIYGHQDFVEESVSTLHPRWTPGRPPRVQRTETDPDVVSRSGGCHKDPPEVTGYDDLPLLVRLLCASKRPRLLIYFVKKNGIK